MVAGKQSGGGAPILMGHLSHMYPSGSSLYFIFLGEQALGEELEQWYTIEKAASECILSHGGTISHHHGVGIDHAEWARKEHGRVGTQLLEGIKHSLDPAGIMNPGKIISD
jgi:alkyldihydroxyacetonephosphate synthase